MGADNDKCSSSDEPIETTSARTSAIPREIYILWLQGETAAPPLVQMCLCRWRRLNPTWRVNVLDSSDVRKLLAQFPLPVGAMQPQALSDVVRLFILKDHGGVWVDATCFPVISLDEWLPDAAQSGFFAFRGHRAPLAVDSWFLAAAPGHVIPRLWWDEVALYWRSPRELITFPSKELWNLNYHFDPLSFFRLDVDQLPVYPYYWVMYIFSHLLETSAEFARAWSRVDVRSGADAHAVQYGTDAHRDVSDYVSIGAASTSPVQKLSATNLNALRWLTLDAAFAMSEVRAGSDPRQGVDALDGVYIPAATVAGKRSAVLAQRFLSLYLKVRRGCGRIRRGANRLLRR